jgi:hypothetical protein
MPCFKPSPTSPFGTARLNGSYATEAECNEACREGACCDGATCTVKPQCQCQGAGKVFKGVGTVCEAGLCECKCGCAASGAATPDHIYATVSGGTIWDGTYVLDRMAGGTATSPQDCFRQAGLNYAAFHSGFWPDFITGSRCCCSYSTLIAKQPGCESFSPPVGDQPWFLDNSAGGFIFAAPGGSWVTLPYSLREQGGVSCCFSAYGNTLAGGSLPGLSSGGGYCSPGWSLSAGTQWVTGIQMEVFNNIPCRQTGGFGYNGPIAVVSLHA